MREWVERLRADPVRWRRFALVLVAVTTLPFIASATSRVHGDTAVYLHGWEVLVHGGGLYRTVPFAYPPYLLAWLPVPGLVAHFFPAARLNAFCTVFALEMLALDAMVKWVLLEEGRARAKGLAALAPFLVFAACAPLQEYVYLKRFDLVPAALTIFAAVAIGRKRWGLAGLLLAIAAGTKAYPLLLVPLALAMAWREKRVRAVVLGLSAGAAPLGILAFVFPWWRFAAFQSHRGLEVESLYASVLWLAHGLPGIHVTWRGMSAWYELGGRTARAVVPFARAVFALVTAVAVAVSVRVGWRSEATAPEAARAMLLPVLAFVAFSYVSSPQYHVWFMGLAALGMLGASRWPAIALLVATALIPIWFPSPAFHHGLDPVQTVALVARNLLLVGVVVGLTRSALRPRSQPGRRDAPGAPGPLPGATEGRPGSPTAAGS